MSGNPRIFSLQDFKVETARSHLLHFIAANPVYKSRPGDPFFPKSQMPSQPMLSSSSRKVRSSSSGSSNRWKNGRTFSLIVSRTSCRAPSSPAHQILGALTACFEIALRIDKRSWPKPFSGWSRSVGACPERGMNGKRQPGSKPNEPRGTRHFSLCAREITLNFRTSNFRFVRRQSVAPFRSVKPEDASSFWHNLMIADAFVFASFALNLPETIYRALRDYPVTAIIVSHSRGAVQHCHRNSGTRGMPKASLI